MLGDDGRGRIFGTRVRSADGQVLVTFTGGREYTYSVADVEQFVTAFNAAASKGRFVNEQIKAETLQKVAV